MGAFDVAIEWLDTQPVAVLNDNARGRRVRIARHGACVPGIETIVGGRPVEFADGHRDSGCAIRPAASASRCGRSTACCWPSPVTRWNAARRAVALEPMECLPDAFNRPDCAEAIRLEPGAARTFRCGVEIDTP
jgi:galactose mutarotase-like enzyme